MNAGSGRPSTGGDTAALAKLERGGGAVWAWRRDRGPLVILTYQRLDRDAVVVEGRIDLGVFAPGSSRVRAADQPVFAGDEAAYTAMLEALESLGWRLPDLGPGVQAVLETDITRTWTLRSDADWSDMRRTVEATVGLVAPSFGDDPSDYRLIYRPAGEEDAGNAQAGCVFAIPSILVGDLVGLVVAIVADWSLPLFGVGVLAAIVGFGIGFMVLGTLVPRVLALIPATRWRAADLGVSLMLILPGVVTLGSWLVAAQLRLRDDNQLLGVSIVLVVGGFILSVLLVLGSVVWDKVRHGEPARPKAAQPAGDRDLDDPELRSLFARAERLTAGDARRLAQAYRNVTIGSFADRIARSRGRGEIAPTPTGALVSAARDALDKGLRDAVDLAASSALRSAAGGLAEAPGDPPVAIRRLRSFVVGGSWLATGAFLVVSALAGNGALTWQPRLFGGFLVVATLLTVASALRPIVSQFARLAVVAAAYATILRDRLAPADVVLLRGPWDDAIERPVGSLAAPSSTIQRLLEHAAQLGLVTFLVGIGLGLLFGDGARPAAFPTAIAVIGVAGTVIGVIGLAARNILTR